MATIVIKTKNKRAIPFLKKLFLNLKDVESFEIVSDSTAIVHESVEQGLYDIKEILTGKKKGITIREPNYVYLRKPDKNQKRPACRG